MIEGRYNLGSVAEMESFARATSRIFRRLAKLPGSLGLLVISCEEWRFMAIGSVTEG